MVIFQVQERETILLFFCSSEHQKIYRIDLGQVVGPVGISSIFSKLSRDHFLSPAAIGTPLQQFSTLITYLYFYGQLKHFLL